MDHSTYIREVPGSDTAVLMIHGILGTPRHFDMLLPEVPASWSVYNLLLPGHGSDAAAFGRSSMALWRGAAQDLFDTLCGKYRRILLVGHSMGSLFSISMAIARPEKVAGLFLLAVPLRVFMKPVMAVNALRVTFGLVREEDPRQTASRDSCSVKTTLKLWQYLAWIPRFTELFREMAKTRKILPLLNVPATAIQSGDDELVSRRSEELLRKNPVIRAISLPGSGHYYYPPADRAVILEKFREFRDVPEDER